MPSAQPFADFMAHFPQTINQELCDFVTDTALQHSRYLFVCRDGRRQIGYCTHCRHEEITAQDRGFLRHGALAMCPECGSKVTVRAAGRSHGKLINDAYVVWYEKSVIHPQAITARGLYVWRDYRQDYHDVETRYQTRHLFLFEPGAKGRKLCLDWHQRWVEAKSVRSESLTSMQFKACFVSEENIRQAVADTPFQYSTWESYTKSAPDLVRFFDLAARYPCVEYLTKLSFGSVVRAKLEGANTFGAVNWLGKTIEKVMRLSKSEIQALRASKLTASPILLHSYHYHKRIGLPLSFEEAKTLEDLCAGYYHDMAVQLFAVAPAADISRYVLKQLRCPQSHYRDAHGVVLAWHDYVRECRELGMDLTQEHVRFPNHLYTAHQKTTVKVKIKADEALNVRIAERLKGLRRFEFAHAELFLRPASDTIELFQEAKILQHCVGSYSARYAEGRCDLFFVRRREDPDKPFYTIEVVEGHIRQAYGLRNCAPTSKVQEFLDAFTAEKLSRAKERRHGAKQEGIAV